jgi:hypothetical protein
MEASLSQIKVRTCHQVPFFGQIPPIQHRDTHGYDRMNTALAGSCTRMCVMAATSIVTPSHKPARVAMTEPPPRAENFHNTRDNPESLRVIMVLKCLNLLLGATLHDPRHTIPRMLCNTIDTTCICASPVMSVLDPNRGAYRYAPTDRTTAGDH